MKCDERAAHPIVVKIAVRYCLCSVELLCFVHKERILV